MSKISRQLIETGQQMIIIEGMDNTGKTTLVNHLLGKFDLDVRKGCGPQGDQLEWVKRELKDPSERTIYDRFTLISEVIYGPICRGKSGIPQPYADHLMHELLRRRPLFIFCTRLFPWDGREQMSGVIDHSSKLIDAYSNKIKEIQNYWSYPALFTYDPTLDGVDKISSLVKVYLTARGVIYP